MFKEIGKCDGQKWAIETSFRGYQIQGKCYAANVDMFKDLKETKFKELKESMLTVTHQMKKKMGSKNGMKIVELEISVTKVELLLGRLNSTFEPAEESANLKTDGERLQNLKHGWEK